MSVAQLVGTEYLLVRLLLLAVAVVNAAFGLSVPAEAGPPWDPTERGFMSTTLKRQEAQQKFEDSKTDIGWGHHIRSYVLDQSRIKDLRTNYEVSNTQAVLDGDLDDFIAASLKQGV